MLTSSGSDSISSPPPLGDENKAERYINQLSRLIDQDKLDVNHTDLKKFDLTSMQDHYRIDLNDYEVEVSHTKQAETGKDFYIMLFNNLKKVDPESCTKIILAYIHLTSTQFKTFKDAASAQLERRRKEAEQKRFREAMMPIDSILSNLNSQPAKKEESQEEVATEPESSASQELHSVLN